MGNKNVIDMLKAELDSVNELLLSLDCGEKKPEDLPLPPNFYINKRERIENLIWAYKVEERSSKNKVENAPD